VDPALSRCVLALDAVAADPVVVIEVLSEGLIDKNREYRATASIQRNVVLQQTHKAAVVFVRQDHGWLSEIVSGDDAILDLPEIDISVPLQEVYADCGLQHHVSSADSAAAAATAQTFRGRSVTNWLYHHRS
jgi:hypothetical protein